jgi:hypothetical protein
MAGDWLVFRAKCGAAGAKTAADDSPGESRLAAIGQPGRERLVPGKRRAKFPLSGAWPAPKVAPFAIACGRVTFLMGKLMGKRDDLIAKYADDLKTKCKMNPDMALLTKVTIGCGPSIYDKDASTVAASQATELETIKANFLMKKLGLADSPKLMEGINAVMEIYGKSERNKHRAVVYYMLVKQFGKEAVYK